MSIAIKFVIRSRCKFFPLLMLWIRKDPNALFALIFPHCKYQMVSDKDEGQMVWGQFASNFFH